MEQWRSINERPAYEVHSLGRVRRASTGRQNAAYFEAKDIKRRIANGEQLKSINRDYSVALHTLSNIKTGRTWKRVEV